MKNLNPTRRLMILALAVSASLSLAACGGGGGGGDETPKTNAPAPFDGHAVVATIEMHVDSFCAPHGKDLGHTPVYPNDARWPESVPKDDIRYAVLHGYCVDQTEYLMAFDTTTGDRLE